MLQKEAHPHWLWGPVLLGVACHSCSLRGQLQHTSSVTPDPSADPALSLDKKPKGSVFCATHFWGQAGPLAPLKALACTKLLHSKPYERLDVKVRANSPAAPIAPRLPHHPLPPPPPPHPHILYMHTLQAMSPHFIPYLQPARKNSVLNLQKHPLLWRPPPPDQMGPINLPPGLPGRSLNPSQPT